MKETYRSPKFKLEGYWARTVKYEDGRNATVLEHREVMEALLGRKLASDEIVHHLNENKTDNRPENLELTTPSKHASHHHADTELVEVQCR